MSSIAATAVPILPAPPETDWGYPDAHNLLPAEAVKKLLDNGRSIAQTGNDDMEPVIKLFTPDAGATWLIVSIEPDSPDILYALCDLGLGCAELGAVSVTELKELRGGMGLRVERDLHFRPDRTIGRYADRARRDGAIRA